jgi:hypothetical protein
VRNHRAIYAGNKGTIGRRGIVILSGLASSASVATLGLTTLLTTLALAVLALAATNVLGLSIAIALAVVR